MIRRVISVTRLLDAGMKVEISPAHGSDEREIALHFDGHAITFTIGDAHVAAALLSAAVAEVMGEAT